VFSGFSKGFRPANQRTGQTAAFLAKYMTLLLTAPVLLQFDKKRALQVDPGLH